MPRFTPNGQHLIAVVEQQNGQFAYNAARLAAMPWPEDTVPAVISNGLDRAVDAYAISPDSNRIYFTAEDGGNSKLFSVRVAGGKVDTLFGVEKGSYTNITIPSGVENTLLFTNWESASRPAEVAIATPLGGNAIVLTRFNGRRAAQLDLPPVEHFWFTSSRGKRIHSLLVRPPGFDATKKYPLFVVIHGGPHSMWRDQFFIRWNYHLLSAPGYVLLLTNYSGSTGFGEQFARSIQGDPFKGPADEINEAADAAISRYSFIDGERQCAGGASYGGHLANWLQGTTTRYKCLVSHAGLVNLEVAVGHERYDLPARDQHGRAAVGAVRGLARAEPGPARGEIPHADARDRGRKRLPRAAQQFARILERPAAHAGAEPAHRVSGRESLDP